MTEAADHADTDIADIATAAAHSAEPPVITGPPPLWPHQAAAIEEALKRKRYALFFDAGTGKTRTAIEVLRRAGTKRKVLILAPLNVVRNWERELIKAELPHYAYIVAGQSKTKKLGIMEAFRASSLDDGWRSKLDAAHILLCNIECVRSLRRKVPNSNGRRGPEKSDYLALLWRTAADFIIVDESHNFKGHDSAQTKGLLELVDKLSPKYLLLLTGTPAPQGEMDLWSTMHLMGLTDEPFFIWRKKWFTDANAKWSNQPKWFPKYVISEVNRQKLRAELSRVSMTAAKDAVLELPPLLRSSLYCEMSPEQTKHYDTMEDYLFAIDSEGNELNASNVLARTLRLQQILAGYLGDVPIKNNPRLEALDAAIDKCPGQFLVWTIFKATYREIADVMARRGISYGFLTGEQSQLERETAMEAFRNGELRCLICHPRAGGVGVNLVEADTSIVYTRGYSLTDDLQLEARNYRGGSEMHKRITRIDIITAGTIDEEIVEALREKKTVQDFVLGLKNRKKEE